MIDRFFGITESGSSIRTEILAGFTTFLTMAYILFVNPDVLSHTGMNKQALLMATALAAAFGSILMGLLANLPFALAPGMGMNAYFTYTVVAKLHIPWQTALAAVFFDGVIFLGLSLTPIRERLIADIPYGIKLATASGIGLFITLIGFRNSGIVTGDAATLLTLGDITSPPVLLSIFGLLLTATLLAREVQGGLLYGILATTLLGFLCPDGQGGHVSHLPAAGTPWVDFSQYSQIFLKLDIGGASQLGLAMVVFTFTFVSMFDTAGTFVGLATKLNWITEEQRSFPRASRGLIADALSVMAGALFGTSTTTTYIESAAGISVGGRTGLTAVSSGFFFFLSLFLAPLAMIVPTQATSPILILVGFLMLEPVLKLHLDDFTEAIPAFLTLVMMPFTYNIANGLIFGILSFVVLKVVTGRFREVSLTTWVLAALFLLKVIYSASS